MILFFKSEYSFILHQFIYKYKYMCICTVKDLSQIYNTSYILVSIYMILIDNEIVKLKESKEQLVKAVEQTQDVLKKV